MQIPNTSDETRRLPLSRKRGVAPRLAWFLLVASGFIVGCDAQVQPKVSPPQQATPPPRDAASLCESIKDIAILPMKDETVPDPAYNALVSAGDDAVPCLIRKITDETKMNDPRQAPKVGFVFVGDTAFFVLAKVGNIDHAGFVELLPPAVRKAFKGDEGIYGYFRYINEDNNRKKLRDAAVKWYELKYGRSLP